MSCVYITFFYALVKSSQILIFSVIIINFKICVFSDSIKTIKIK